MRGSLGWVARRGGSVGGVVSLCGGAGAMRGVAGGLCAWGWGGVSGGPCEWGGAWGGGEWGVLRGVGGAWGGDAVLPASSLRRLRGGGGWCRRLSPCIPVSVCPRVPLSPRWLRRFSTGAWTAPGGGQGGSVEGAERVYGDLWEAMGSGGGWGSLSGGIGVSGHLWGSVGLFGGDVESTTGSELCETPIVLCLLCPGQTLCLRPRLPPQHHAGAGLSRLRHADRQG